MQKGNFQYYFQRGTYYLKLKSYLTALKDFNASIEPESKPSEFSP